MIKPYIKKYSETAGFKVFIVDGEYVRDNLNREFTNFGQHYRFKFIPLDEFWIDEENSHHEERFFIDHLLVENRLMRKGMSYGEALEKADRIEKRERKKIDFMLVRLKKKELMEKIHKKLLKKYSKKLSVWIIDGELVRDSYDIDFTEGGHGLVYPFVPKDEIWIDDDLSSKEIKFVLLHEMHERNLMAKGWCYDTNKYHINSGKIKKSAHGSAHEVEYFCRKHPEETDRKLLEEVEKQE